MWDDCLNPKSLISLDPKSVIDASGYHLLGSRICFVLGLIFAILGIISDAINTSLGLEPMSWLLLAVVTCLIAVACFIAWALAVILDAMEAKGEKQSSD